MKTKTKTQLTLDPFTLKVLTNFATINNGLVVKSGNEIRTMTEGKTVLAEATLPDTFPVDFAIYDLRQMLNFISTLFDNPTMEFSSSSVEISNDNDVTKIFYCNPDLISSPSKRITMPSEDITLQISEETLKKITKSGSILGVDDLKISSVDDDMISIEVLDKTNSSTNTWSTKTSGTCNSEFAVYLKISNLKLLEGDYQITISNKGITCFKHMNNDVRYYIAVEADSKFN
jgi:gp45 sliding clamp, C terminal